MIVMSWELVASAQQRSRELGTFFGGASIVCTGLFFFVDLLNGQQPGLVPAKPCSTPVSPCIRTSKSVFLFRGCCEGRGAE